MTAAKDKTGEDVGLLPCPFCGGPADLHFVTGMSFNWECGCDACRVHTSFYCKTGSHIGDPAKMQAVEAWNTRTPSPPLPEGGEVERAVRRLEIWIGDLSPSHFSGELHSIARDLRAALTASAPAPQAGVTRELPCDVMLPPKTIIKKGCSLETLLVGLNARTKFPEEACRFAPSHAGVSGTVEGDHERSERVSVQTSPSRDLIEQLEKATGSDRTLDRTLHRKLTGCIVRGYAPHYTGSIDVAMTLVPKGLMFSMTGMEGKASVTVKTGSIINPETKEWQGYSTPAIALCIAALRARIAMNAVTDAQTHVSPDAIERMQNALGGVPVGWSEDERHAVAHAKYLVERATPENPEVSFDYTLVATLLQLISAAPESPSQRQEGDMRARALQIIADENRFAASDPPGNIELHALRFARVGTAKQILGEIAMSEPVVAGSIAAAIPLPASPSPAQAADTAETCIACDKPLIEGDLVYSDASGGTIHATCCGPERESYTNADGEPLKPGEPIPAPWKWHAMPARQCGAE